MLALLAVAGACAAAGGAVGRWWVVALAACTWPLVFLGLAAGWWGAGLGENWEAALARLAVASVSGAVFGLLARRIVAPRGRRGGPGAVAR
jgi:hypothetical protein